MASSPTEEAAKEPSRGENVVEEAPTEENVREAREGSEGEIIKSKEGESAPGNDNEPTAAEDDETANDVPEDKTREAPAGADGPPLPDEPIPPLPEEEPPASEEQDDGWAPIWDETAQAFYFYNRFTGVTQWNNPRVPDEAQPGPPGVPSDTASSQAQDSASTRRPAGGYDPAIHGDYDENAWYAQPEATEEAAAAGSGDPKDVYAATAAFNRFTGRFQQSDLNPDRFSDENKSRRQMNAFFDVDAAANSHDGRSLKAERSGKKLTKAELKQFKEKRKAKKEERRRAWLRD